MADDKPSYPPIRRVVTGHDANNKAKVILDSPATNAKHPQPGMVSTMMWCTDGAPCAMPIGENAEDMGARIIGTAPPAKGTRFAVIDFPPGNHPGMHRTETIDYVIVIEGEIEMDMDDFDGQAEGRRHHDPARHQPRLGQPQQQTRARRVRADRRRAARHRQAGPRNRQRALTKLQE